MIGYYEDRLEPIIRHAHGRLLNIGGSWGGVQNPRWEGERNMTERIRSTGLFELTSIDLHSNDELGIAYGNAEDLDFSDSSFDSVYIGNVLEHLENPMVAMKECSRVLADGGTIIVEVPNVFSELCMYNKGVLDISRHPHLYNWYLPSLCLLLERAGFGKVESGYINPRPFKGALTRNLGLLISFHKARIDKHESWSIFFVGKKSEDSKDVRINVEVSR